MATNSGMGKSTFVADLTLYSARIHNEIVLNYQVELGVPEFVTLAASHLLRKDRNHLTDADYREAQRMLKGVRYYVGRNPNLATVEPTLDLIEDAIRRLGVTTAVLDNLHFICRNEENEVQAQANAMQRIKRMAQKYGVKFIVVGQPRKAKQDARGKQTHLTDWRGSAAGVDDADALFTLHRKWLRSAEDNPEQDEYDPLTTVKRLKARACGDGPAGAQLMFHGEIASFSEIVSEHATDMFGSGELL
jgi:replicative DNA helicase